MDVVVAIPRGFKRCGPARGLVALFTWWIEQQAQSSTVAWVLKGAPRIDHTERVYFAYCGRLIGHAPVLFYQPALRRGWGDLVMEPKFTACTLDRWIAPISRFKYRDWERDEEQAIDLTAWYPEIRRLPATLLWFFQPTETSR